MFKCVIIVYLKVLITLKYKNADSNNKTESQNKNDFILKLLGSRLW